MSSRAIRRAAAHLQRKAARKAAALQPAAVATVETLAPEILPEIISTPNAPIEISPAQLAANRANSLKSSGPRTPAGKAIVSLNAVKSGLTGRTVVLPSDDVALYESHLRGFEKLCAPVGFQESCLTQTLADTQWRLDRANSLELALFTKGRQEFTQLFEEGTPSNMIDLHTATVYDKQLRNFQLQESRLFRRFEKSWAQLMALQKARIAQKQADLERAAEACLLAQHRNQPFDLTANGFEFSKPVFDSYFARLTRVRKEELLQKALAEAVEIAHAAA
jgi:hypothetical protein